MNSLGIAAGLHHWVIPLIRIGSTSRSKIAQFQLSTALGNQYLQTSRRLTIALLLATTLLLRTHPSASVARVWTYYASALALIVPLAPYEHLVVSPVSARILQLGDELKLESKETFEDGCPRREQLNGLLTAWQRRHTGSVLMPFAAAVTAALGLLAS
jgi:hypothetical protein